MQTKAEFAVAYFPDDKLHYPLPSLSKSKSLDSYDQWPGEDKGVRKAKSSQHMSESIIIRTEVYLTGPRGGSFPVK